MNELFNGLQVNKTDWAHIDSVKAPWRKIYERFGLPVHADYCRGSMYDAVKKARDNYPEYMALGFMDNEISFNELIDRIDECAKALKAIGIAEGDTFTIAMPNCPQAIYMIYALNKIGAIANMVHPLASAREIEFFLNEAKSDSILTLDQFYDKVKEIRARRPIKNVIITSIKDELNPLQKIGYSLKQGKDIPSIPKTDDVILWKNFIKKASSYSGETYVAKDEFYPAMIFYSGGTTGTTKGVVLSNGNYNAFSAIGMSISPTLKPGHKMLAATPIFHGYGFGAGVHVMLTHSMSAILVPRFSAESCARQIIKHKCNMISGVPSLYEALLRVDSFDKADLSFLVACYAGGDSLPIPLKKRMDSFLKQHGSKIQICEGFGMTETSAACILTPLNEYREGAIGIPFPDTFIKICKPGTDQELPYGEEGELLIAGPSIMLGYLNNPKETEETLTLHDDGLVWLHTGDLASMDADGYLYYKGRIKRVIISSGYSIYPAQVVSIIDAHPLVHLSCVIGVDDPIAIKKLKAYIILKSGVPKTYGTLESIEEYLEKNVAKYALPKEIEFRDTLPMTLFGKVSYRELETEANKEAQNG